MAMAPDGPSVTTAASPGRRSRRRRLGPRARARSASSPPPRCRREGRRCRRTRARGCGRHGVRRRADLTAKATPVSRASLRQLDRTGDGGRGERRIEQVALEVHDLGLVDAARSIVSTASSPAAPRLVAMERSPPSEMSTWHTPVGPPLVTVVTEQCTPARFQVRRRTRHPPCRCRRRRQRPGEPPSDATPAAVLAEQPPATWRHSGKASSISSALAASTSVIPPASIRAATTWSSVAYASLSTRAWPTQRTSIGRCERSWVPYGQRASNTGRDGSGSGRRPHTEQ